MKNPIRFVTLYACIQICIFANVQAQTLEETLAGKINYIVSQDGTGDFETVQEAIDAMPDSSETPLVIFIRRGKYYEKVRIPYTKPNITLVGEDVDSTILTHDDYPGVMPDNSTFGTYSFRCDAENFSAYNLTFENSAGDVGQALAYSSYGDKQFFYHCRFLGYQDTYFINYRCRNYMKDCYIEGATDYIYGFGIGVYDSCQIHTVRYQGVITAAATSSFYRFGLTFRNCRITSPTGISSVFLGRPWHGRPHVAYLFCDETDGLNPLGWRAMNEGLSPLFAEYACTGEGYQPDQRSTEPDYPGIQLTEEEAAPYSSLDTLFAAASFADPSDDEAEILEMRTPFDNNDLTDLILEVMYSGRDTFPPIPADDWHPDIASDTILEVIRDNYLPFMDSTYGEIPTINMIYAGGEELDNFDQEIFEYAVELPEGATTPAVLTVDAEGAIISIEYPDDVPAYSHVFATTLDRVTQYEYEIYNSVDSSFWNADLAFLGYNTTDTIPLEDNKYTYDVMLPEGVTQVFSLQAKTQIRGSTYKTTKPEAVPGTGTVLVTALDELTGNTYTINFSLYTDITNREVDNDLIRISNPVQDVGVLYLRQAVQGDLYFRLYDMTGKLVLTKRMNISSADTSLPLDFSGLTEGMYYYRLSLNEYYKNGKLVKNR